MARPGKKYVSFAGSAGLGDERQPAKKPRGRPSDHKPPSPELTSKALDALDLAACALRAGRSYKAPSGQTLYYWRLSREVALSSITQRIGVSARTWYKWEREDSKMSEAQFALFAIKELGLLKH